MIDMERMNGADMKSIVFRADANPEIGMGHIMRCLSIADAFSGDYNVLFILADKSPAKIISDRGYESMVLGSDYRNPDDEEAFWPKEITPDLIIVDSYFVTDDYMSFLRKRCGILVYVDDLIEHPFKVDVVINYNAYADAEKYQNLYEKAGIDEPKLMIGTDYVPLRSDFYNVPNKITSPEVKDVLISTGGADPMHLAIDMVKALSSDDDKKFNFHFLIGAMNSDKKEIYSASEDKANVIIHENVRDMRALISSMDIILSASGSTLYEVCACGIPLITFVMADNQILGADSFDKRGLAVFAGDLRNEKREDRANLLLEKIYHVSDDYQLRKSMAETMRKLVDGQGARKIVQVLSDIERSSN